MGITITQTRPVVTSVSSTRVIGPVPFEQNLDNQRFLGVGAALQTTTSYRSGGSLPSDEEVDATQAESGSWASSTAALGDQRMRGPRSSFDTGHPFSTEKRYVENFTTYSSIRQEGVVTYLYDGAVRPSQTIASLPRFYSPEPFDAAYWGSRAIASCAPSRPAASLLTAIGELKREGLPALPLFNTIKGKGSHGAFGSEYLNSEFGIKPLLRDLRESAGAILALKKLVAQYERDSGKVIRRRFRFPVSRDTIFIGTRTDMPVSPLTNHGGIKLWKDSNGNLLSSVDCRQSETLSTFRYIRFSGGFLYNSVVPDGGRQAILEHAREALHFLGLELTPKTVWDLQPWTWLLDWQWNIGSLMENLSIFQSDDLVLKYGYIMCEDRLRHSVVAEKTTVTKSGPAGPFAIDYVTKRKLRVKANPYGFSIVPGGFSDRQWNILGALGLTRAPKTLS